MADNTPTQNPSDDMVTMELKPVPKKSLPGLKSAIMGMGKNPIAVPTEDDLVEEKLESARKAFADKDMAENIRRTTELVIALELKIQQLVQKNNKSLIDSAKIMGARFAQQYSIESINKASDSGNYKLLDTFVKKVVRDIPERLKRQVYNNELETFKRVEQNRLEQNRGTNFSRMLEAKNMREKFVESPYGKRIVREAKKDVEEKRINRINDARKEAWDNSILKKIMMSVGPKGKEKEESKLLNAINKLANIFERKNDTKKDKDNSKYSPSKRDADIEKIRPSERVKKFFDVGGSSVDKFLNAPEVLKALGVKAVDKVVGSVLGFGEKIFDFIWDHKMLLGGVVGLGALFFDNIQNMLKKGLETVTGTEGDKIMDLIKDSIGKKMSSLSGVMVAGGSGALIGLQLGGPWGALIGFVVGSLSSFIAGKMMESVSDLDKTKLEIDPEKLLRTDRQKSKENAALEKQLPDLDASISQTEKDLSAAIARKDDATADTLTKKLDDLKQTKEQTQSRIKTNKDITYELEVLREKQRGLNTRTAELFKKLYGITPEVPEGESRDSEWLPKAILYEVLDNVFDVAGLAKKVESDWRH